MKLPTIAIKIGAKAVKHAPKICLIGGTALVISGTVLIAKSAKKQGDIDEINLKEKEELFERLNAGEDISESEATRDKIKVNAHCAVRTAKNYAPGVILEAAGLGLIGAGYGIVNKRYIQAAAAAASAVKAKNELFKRMAERLGYDEAAKIKYGITEEKVKFTETDDKGKTKTKTKTLDKLDYSNIPDVSDKAVFFDEFSTYWEKNPECNMMTIRQAIDWAKRTLETRGFVFYNELLNQLGLPMNKKFIAAGWALGVADEIVVDSLETVGKPGETVSVPFDEATRGLSFLLDFNCIDDIRPYM
jgi:hypothetical protein